jgi:eukaryotic-like serine/threonine-protein kinase
MLQNVRKFWIEGVLENSLYVTTLLELGLKQTSGKVENPWETLLRKPGLEDEILPIGTRILDVFERLNGKFLILGDPGSGKTTSLLELARDLLVHAETDDAHPIPVVFNLSSWSEERKPLTDWLIDELSGKYLVPKKVASEWLETDVLLLLDGLDEVALQYRDNCVQAINTYREEHGFADIVVCSRTADYEALANRFKLNGAIVIQPLDDTQIDQYLTRLGPELSTVRTMVQEDEALIELSRSPLMLSILVLAYRGVSPKDLPTYDTPEAQRKHLFDVYVQRMFERRGRETLYTQQQTTHYLNWLARSMLQHSQSVFQIEKMQPIWLSESQHRWFGSVLRLIHWPFTAIINGIPFLLAGPAMGISGWIFGLSVGVAGFILAWTALTGSYWKRNVNMMLIGSAYGLAWGVSIGSAYGLSRGFYTTLVVTIIYSLGNMLSITIRRQMDGEQNHIAVVEKLRFSTTKITPWAGTAGLVMGFVNIFGFQVTLGSDTVNLSQFTLGCASSCVIFSISFLVLSGLTADEVAIRTQPNEGIRRSLANANLFAIATFIAISLLGILGISWVTSLEKGLAVGLAAGVSTSYGFWFIFGGYSVLQHLTLRFVLTRSGLVPWNYAQFLDSAASCILLRKVGGGYIFIPSVPQWMKQLDSPSLE